MYYGADIPGSLTDDDVRGLNMNRIDKGNLLWELKEQLQGSDGSSKPPKKRKKTDFYPGIFSPMLYWGMFASTFCPHTEDLEAYSVNFNHTGAPKIW